jgi:hypothetical protein
MIFMNCSHGERCFGAREIFYKLQPIYMALIGSTFLAEEIKTVSQFMRVHCRIVSPAKNNPSTSKKFRTKKLESLVSLYTQDATRQKQENSLRMRE